MKLLLKYGADPRAPDEEGTTPFDLARPHKEVLVILHKANSKVDSFRDKAGVPCANCGEYHNLKYLILNFVFIFG